ncbi:MAG: hypothetical protein AAB574_02680 [Patescibacteria group bacterium]
MTEKIKIVDLPYAPGYGLPETREAIAKADKQLLSALTVNAICALNVDAFESSQACARAESYLRCRQGTLSVIEYSERNSQKSS